MRKVQCSAPHQQQLRPRNEGGPHWKIENRRAHRRANLSGSRTDWAGYSFNHEVCRVKAWIDWSVWADCSWAATVLCCYALQRLGWWTGVVLSTGTVVDRTDFAFQSAKLRRKSLNKLVQVRRLGIGRDESVLKISDGRIIREQSPKDNNHDLEWDGEIIFGSLL